MKAIEYLDSVMMFSSMLVSELAKTLLSMTRGEVQQVCTQSATAAENLLGKMQHVFKKCDDDRMRVSLEYLIKQIQEKIILLKGTYVPEFFIPIIGAMAYIGGVSQTVEHLFIKELLDYKPA